MNLVIEKTAADDSRKVLEGLLDRAEPQLKRRFLEVIKDIKESFDLDELAALIERGRFNEALASAELRFGAYAGKVNAIYILAGQDTAKLLNDSFGVIVDFDQTNDRAVRQMRESRLRLIREFTQGQTASTREALTSGIERGLNPINQARGFRDSIGLTQRQQQAVHNYRRLLQEGDRESLSRSLRDRRFDSSVARSIRDGKPLTPDQVDRMVSRYQDRYVRYRSEVIARTEALRSVHQGTEEMYQQAIDSGQLDPNKLRREWLTAQDESVRGSHASMNGQIQPIGSPYISGKGNYLMYPGDPNAPAAETIQCRCLIVTELVGEANAQ